ncbi:diguanylate cyclase [Pseudomonas syringae pv. actinidiae]|nr:diguanylate cyclase [Pseudomonas syringae pv. actinidiae]
MTGLANRRCFDQTLTKEARRAQREGTTLVLLMIDIDYFKRFNDTFGHVAGDVCLRAVGEILEDSVKRPSDLVARYGGEEMGIIMPNTDGQGATVVAQLIIDRLERKNIRHNSSPFGRVSVSIGIIAAAGSQLDNLMGFIQGADRALYNAKALGRNQFATGAL